jgi:hypothetical protein
MAQRSVKWLINIGESTAQMRLSEPVVKEHRQDLLVAKTWLRRPREAMVERRGSRRRTFYAWRAEMGEQRQGAVATCAVDAEWLTPTRAHGRWAHACIAATARAVDMTNASPRATPSAMTSG